MTRAPQTAYRHRQAAYLSIYLSIYLPQQYGVYLVPYLIWPNVTFHLLLSYDVPYTQKNKKSKLQIYQPPNFET
jgi:hypothetical protein